MHSLALIAASLPLLAAAWDSKLCNNVGGCSTSTWRTQMPFRCPDGTRQNILETGRTLNAMSDGNYSVVTDRAEFPAACLNGPTPGAADTLAVVVSPNGQNNYYFLTGECTSEKLATTDCYIESDNRFQFHLCQVVDPTGGVCTLNTSAGKCESYGDVRKECVGWTPEQVEEPCTFNGEANNCR
ncbi:hypothetical protein BS50DRAFT_635552 [Corynespora cassiicola Philippines]|uniref:Uncharacterized protein n=1 Tax=Corynespora cassiicola Philippines TaxID=1448308 RepID=A0A2T2NLX2_CORCC|nr:hypothetical protein BS50DRAFT_635552 [Corynespora cassiicola Philippines]